MLVLAMLVVDFLAVGVENWARYGWVVLCAGVSSTEGRMVTAEC